MSLLSAVKAKPVASTLLSLLRVSLARPNCMGSSAVDEFGGLEFEPGKLDGGVEEEENIRGGLTGVEVGDGASFPGLFPYVSPSTYYLT